MIIIAQDDLDHMCDKELHRIGKNIVRKALEKRFSKRNSGTSKAWYPLSPRLNELSKS